MILASPISQKERFFAPLRMTADRVVILNEVKDLEPKGVATPARVTFVVAMIYAKSQRGRSYTAGIRRFGSKEIIPRAFYRWFHAINPTG